MFGSNLRITTWFAVAFASLSLTTTPAGAQTGVVTIGLRSAATVSGNGAVTISTVADVSGGTLAIRNQIENLDLEASCPNTYCDVSKRQVEIRLLIAGYSRQDFRVVGPAELRVRKVSVNDLKIKLQNKIGSEISRQFGLSKDNVTVRLSNDRQVASMKLEAVDSSENVTVIVQANLPVGRTKVQLVYFDPEGNQTTNSVDAEVTVVMPVALATQPIERGTVIRADMFRMIDRPFRERKNLASPEYVIGKVARQRIPGNDVILSNHLATQTARQSQDVKINSLLDVIVRINGSEVRLKNAKALGSGNRGDTVAVQNMKSGKRFNAKVIGKHLAEVSFGQGIRR